MKCLHCGRRAVTLMRYSGAHLCARHFSGSVERRVKRALRMGPRVRPGERIAVAVSGGKDSTVALHLVHAILGRVRGVEISAITVDEGIAAYRPAGLRAAARAARLLGVPHTTVSLEKEFGVTLDRLFSGRKRLGRETPCTLCGVLRRAALNRAARAAGAAHLATGLNLDDTVQSFLMNLARGDVERLLRMGPHLHTVDGLIPRLQPLRMVPDKESFLYATMNSLEFHNAECPYSGEAMRNRYRETVLALEEESPGTRFALLKSCDMVREALLRGRGQAALKVCRSCGEPAAGEECRTCALIGALQGKPGPGA